MEILKWLSLLFINLAISIIIVEFFKNVTGNLIIGCLSSITLLCSQATIYWRIYNGERKNKNKFKS